jgi:hypothetical protein
MVLRFYIFLIQNILSAYFCIHPKMILFETIWNFMATTSKFANGKLKLLALFELESHLKLIARVETKSCWTKNNNKYDAILIINHKILCCFSNFLLLTKKEKNSMCLKTRVIFFVDYKIFVSLISLLISFDFE